MLKKQHQLFVALFGLADAIVVCMAAMLAWLVRLQAVNENYARPNWESWVKGPLFIFVVPVTLYTLRYFDLYRPRRDRSVWAELVQVIKGSIMAIGGMIVVMWAVGNRFLDAKGGFGYGTHVPGVDWLTADRVQIAALAVALPLFLGVHRLGLRLVLRSIRRRGRNLRHVAIVGDSRLGQIVLRTLERNSWTGLSVAYFVSHHDQARRDRVHDRPVFGGLADLEATLEKSPVDSIYLALPNSRAAEVPRILQRLERYPIDVRIVPDVQSKFVPQSMVVNELDGMPILSYRENPSLGLGGLTKRGMDIAGALAAMVLFAPLMACIAIAIRWSGPGPIIFKQRRVSIAGKTFKIYKFRTMRHVLDERGRPSPGPARWTDDNDPRITTIGRWLRSTSLDELPQLLNVLKGQMSLVGPRPERPELIAQFRENWRGYMIRQHVKAGMTGWAQVNGMRGNTSLAKRLKYDRFYVRHWSPWFDLWILWLTVFRGFAHPNAR